MCERLLDADRFGIPCIRQSAIHACNRWMACESYSGREKRGVAEDAEKLQEWIGLGRYLDRNPALLGTGVEDLHLFTGAGVQNNGRATVLYGDFQETQAAAKSQQAFLIVIFR